MSLFDSKSNVLVRTTFVPFYLTFKPKNLYLKSALMSLSGYVWEEDMGGFLRGGVWRAWFIF